MRSTTISFSRSCSMGQGLAINEFLCARCAFYHPIMFVKIPKETPYTDPDHELQVNGKPVGNASAQASTNGRPDTCTIGRTSGCKSGKQCFQSHLLHCMTYETSTGSSFLQPLHNSWRKGQCSMALRQQCLHSLESDNQICPGASNNTKWQWQMWMTNQSRDQI